MNLMNRIISYDKNQCYYENCKPIIKNQTMEYQPLTEEEIEQIIKERYDYKDDKTKIFIRKALRKHGDRYEYSNVIYIKSSKKVEIICRVEGHESFWQKANSHLNGSGCPICGGTKKSTTETFIIKANEKHGVGTYNYSKVEYIDNKTDVIIICPIHGDFKQAPNNHLNGQGCPICAIEKRANERRLTLEEFIEKAREIHGNKYDYTKVVYINNHTDIIIICPKHGEFIQTPSNHLLGKGCSLCANEKISELNKSNTKEFIEKANEVQGISYDYSKVEYIDAKTKVIIICPKHGEFLQEPSNHLSGQGCPKCNKNKGEESVRKFLTEKGIEFEEQKKFEGCEYKKLLRFDFYIPKYNLCIESDGEPHFKNINWNGKYTDDQLKERLEVYQLRDQIKNDYCKNNGINLLRIRYDENVEEKLTEYFQNH